MKTFIFCFKALIHLIWVFLTPFLNHKYKLSFTKEDNGNWYIDLPDWPFSHDNLQMVAGADTLCDELDDYSGHVNVDVYISKFRMDRFESGPESMSNIRYDREWAYLKWGGQYKAPDFIMALGLTKIPNIWLCQVTLFVLGWWPKYIYISGYNKIIKNK